MALNGGVSLAVWMGGCAVELDAARRAHLGEEKMAYDGYVPAADGRTEVRRIYNGLCEAFDRRLSIDILSGASAGGINGALLSAAMVAGRRLHPDFVRERWLELGHLSKLLNDPGKAAPKALMDGDMFGRELLRAFRAVCGEEGFGDEAESGKSLLSTAELPRAQRLKGDRARIVPDLDVTMTDAIGAELTFTDEWMLPLVAREHAPRFRFREEDHYTAPVLAAAAHASASFPIAFEPLKVPEGAATLAGLSGQTYAIDGGLLDNAPIRAALDRIPFRRARHPVRRYACYVNADPTQPAPRGDDGLAAPDVIDVLGYVLELPRTAPFAGQLYAVREAVKRPAVTRLVVKELLGMELTALERTADALLPAYRRRRTATSINELVGDPAAARLVREETDPDGAELPWIPSADNVEPPAPGSWEWGIRPAQRILYLLIDLLREGIGDAGGEGGEALLSLRAELDERIARLEERNGQIRAGIDRFGKEPPGMEARERASRALAAMKAALEDREAEIYALLQQTAVDLLESGEGGRAVFEPVFAPPEDEEGPPSDWLGLFFRRLLAIEVVRRALGEEAEIDTGQRLSFVQLTPAAPTPIFAQRPTAPPRPTEAKEKLTGLGLAHFAGFYRRAWRANDFMWGRLDAAARVVDLLLDRPPEGEDSEDDAAREATADRRAAILTRSVLGDDPTAEERWLVEEALLDKDWLPCEECAEALDPEELAAVLRMAIRSELQNAGPSPRADELPLTRAVCARAAQLEAIRDELPALVAEASGDGALGSSGRPLELGGEDASLREQIEALRENPSLPQRLTGKGEAVSRLGLAMGSRAARVGISMAESTGAPLSRLLGTLRVPAVAVAGVAARERLHRLTVALGFSAAAVYLTSRFVTTEPQTAAVSDLVSAPVLLSLVALLVVLPAILVPALQAVHGIARPLNAARAAALALCGGFGARRSRWPPRAAASPPNRCCSPLAPRRRARPWSCSPSPRPPAWRLCACPSSAKPPLAGCAGPAAAPPSAS